MRNINIPYTVVAHKVPPSESTASKMRNNLPLSFWVYFGNSQTT